MHKHIICISYHENVAYKPIGPFDTKELADEWLKKNGFIELIPGHWEKRTKSRFLYYNMPTDTSCVKAITSHLISPSDLGLIDLSNSES